MEVHGGQERFRKSLSDHSSMSHPQMQDTFQKHCKGKLEKCSVDRQIEMLNSLLENMNVASLRLKRQKDHPACCQRRVLQWF